MKVFGIFTFRSTFNTTATIFTLPEIMEIEYLYEAKFLAQFVLSSLKVDYLLVHDDKKVKTELYPKTSY